MQLRTYYMRNVFVLFKLQYETPINRRYGYNVALVTPGPNSKKPINILRQPKPGEMAISMSGSPLLIAHNNLPVNVPQITFRLANGKVRIRPTINSVP